MRARAHVCGVLDPRDLNDRQRRAWDAETARLQRVSERYHRAAFRPGPPERPWWDEATSQPLDDLARQWHVA